MKTRYWKAIPINEPPKDLTKLWNCRICLIKEDGDMKTVMIGMMTDWEAITVGCTHWLKEIKGRELKTFNSVLK